MLTREDLIARLSKTGGTPYKCLNVVADVVPGLILSAATINAMRRDALNLLTAQRARHQEPRLNRPEKIHKYPGVKSHPELTIQVTTREQITPAVLRLKPTVLYVPLHLLTQDKNWTMALLQRARVCPVLPRIIHDGEMNKVREQLLALRELGVRDVLVGNYGHIIPVRECGLRCRGDFGLNLYNSGAVAAAAELELRSAALSFEMTLPQIRDVSKPLPCELLVYGRLPLMVTENCLIRGRTVECTCHQGAAKLMDKTGAEFPIIKDGDSCRSILLNGKKLYWLDRQEDLNKLNLWAMRLCFTTENTKEVDQVIASCHKPAPFDPGACTRGLYLRGVE
jgi:putative protease